MNGLPLTIVKGDKMPNEVAFQIIVTLSMIAFLAIRLYYRLKTRTLRLELASSRDNKMMRRFLPILFILFLGILIWLLNPALMVWSALAWPAWVRWVGTVLVFVGLALLVWVHEALGANFSGNLEIREHHKLVTMGPYRWVRHPMYTAILLFVAGIALMTANWFIVLLPLAFALFFVLRAPNEEKLMVEAFGNEYQDYKKRTGRFLPRLIG